MQTPAKQVNRVRKRRLSVNESCDVCPEHFNPFSQLAQWQHTISFDNMISLNGFMIMLVTHCPGLVAIGK